MSRSPRLGSSAKSWRRWVRLIFWWCFFSSAQAGRRCKAGTLIDCSLAQLRLARSATRLESMRSIRSFQDLTNDAAPSSWSWAASASMSMPALAKSARTVSQSPPSGAQRRADLAVVGEGLEGALGHGVDREGRGERLHIEGVGGLRVLGAGAGPQQALGAGAGVGGALEARRGEQLAIGLVGALGDGDAEPVGELGRNLAGDRDVPAADEERGHRGDGRVQAGRDAPLDAAQVGIGRRDVLLAREQQRDVDRHAGEDRLLDGGQAFRGAGNLDEEVGLAGALDEGRAQPRACSSVSWASSGETSSDTQPSTPSVRSKIGRNRSAAWVRSASASSKNSSSRRLGRGRRPANRPRRSRRCS